MSAINFVILCWTCWSSASGSSLERRIACAGGARTSQSTSWPCFRVLYPSVRLSEVACPEFCSQRRCSWFHRNTSNRMVGPKMILRLGFADLVQSSDREDFNSSNGSTISTSLIHNIASDGNSEQVVTWFLNRILQTKNDCGLGNLSNCSSDICCLCYPTKEFCGNSTGVVELTVDGLLANVGIATVSLFCCHLLWKKYLSL